MKVLLASTVMLVVLLWLALQVIGNDSPAAVFVTTVVLVVVVRWITNRLERRFRSSSESKRAR